MNDNIQSLKFMLKGNMSLILTLRSLLEQENTSNDKYIIYHLSSLIQNYIKLRDKIFCQK